MPSTQMPAHQPEPTLTKLFRAAIGPINTDVYLPIFTRFEANGRAGLSWNSAASMYTLNWLVFRGLWGLALGYLAVLVFLPLLTLGLGRLVLDWSESVELAVGLIGLLLFFVLPGLGGNALFYRATRKNMEAALAASATFDQACGLLASQSSSRQRFIRILATNAALLCLLAPLLVLLYARFSTEPEPGPERANDVPAAVSPVFSVQPLASASAPMPVIAPASAPASAALPTSPVPAVSLPQPAASAPAPVVSAPAPAVSAPAPEVSMPAPAVSAPARKASAPQPVASVAVHAVSKPKKPSSSPARAGDFYVNVGLFAEASNAQRAHDKLSAADLPVASQQVRSPKGDLTRVRVGPFASRSQAAEAALQIKAMKLDAVVVQP